MLNYKNKKILTELFSIYFAMSTLFTPIILVANVKIDLERKDVEIILIDSDTREPIVCPKGKTCSFKGKRERPVFRDGPIADLSDILTIEDMPAESDIPFDALPRQESNKDYKNQTGIPNNVSSYGHGSRPHGNRIIDSHDICDKSSKIYSEGGCHVSGFGDSVLTYPGSGNTTPYTPTTPPDQSDNIIANNKEKLIANKKQFKNNRELHKAFINTLNDEQVYHLVGRLVNHGVAKAHNQLVFSTKEIRELNPYPDDEEKDFYNAEVEYLTVPEAPFKNINSLVKFHNSRLTEYLKQVYEAGSQDEAEGLMLDYDFLESELRLKGIIDAEGKIIAPNVKQPNFLLQTDSRSQSGRSIRNIYNEHIANKSTVNTYCKMGKNKRLCEGIKAGNRVTDLAIYALDNAVVNNKKITQKQLNESAKKIKSNIDFTSKLASAMSGQIKDEAKKLIDDILSAPSDIADAVYNYEKTFSAIVGLYENRNKIFEQIGNSLANNWDKLKNGTASEKGEVLGKVAFEAALMFAAPLKVIKGVKTAKKAKDLTKASEKFIEPIIEKAKKIDVKTKVGINSFAKLYYGLKTLPTELQPKRILEGSDPNKIAIIGRKMKGNVDEVAEHLKKEGLNVSTFKSSRDLNEKFEKQAIQYNRNNNITPGTYLPHNEILKSAMYKANKQWAQKLKNEGYTVIDVGNPLDLKMSAFYTMEKLIVFAR